ncbi:MAG: hypothetical protein IPK19_08270 [Chloroflexi bacterium]|nr:hypothetical protein [Chloroflexota bacterium]
MVHFPEEIEGPPEGEESPREEWLEVVEDEEIAEGDITVSETVDGHDPTPDLDDDDEEALRLDEEIDGAGDDLLDPSDEDVL